MGARRFFVDGIRAVGDTVTLSGTDARKATLVLRLSDGDALELCDSSGRTFDARLRIDSTNVLAELVGELAGAPASGLEITLAQAVPKGQKMDFIVEKSTELGVARIVPAVTERSLGEPPQAKHERWQRLARTAAQQSGRSDVPAIGPAQSWHEIFTAWQAVAGSIALVPWEVSERVQLRETLPPLVAGARHVLVAIGPEGGLSHSEAAFAQERGATLISLGHRILRTETAGAVVCALLHYVAGDL